MKAKPIGWEGESQRHRDAYFKNKQRNLNKKKWGVWSLDVWGDKEEWNVNDRSLIGYVMLDVDKDSDKDILKAMKEGGFIKKHITTRSITIDGDDQVLYINDSIGMPVFELTLEE